MKRIDACATRVLGCFETKPGDTPCRVKAAEACVRGLAKLAGDETKLRTIVFKRCGVLTPFDRGRIEGLGFDGVAAETCAALGTPLLDLNGLVDCVLRRHACEVDALMSLAEPRAGEFLRLIDVPLPGGICLQDFGGVGADIGDQGTAAKDLVKCARAVTGAARTLAQRRLARVAGCVNAVFGCVQNDPGEICFARASVRCGNDAVKVLAAEAAFAATAKRCNTVPFMTLASPAGLNLAALEARCARYGVGSITSLGTYQECLRRSHACGTAAMIAAQAPRAAQVLGLVRRPLADTFCPAP